MAAPLEKPIVKPIEQSTSKLEFRPFNQKTELPLQRELFSDAFPEAVNTSQEKGEHYNWKFCSFPSSKSAYEYGAYLDGKMVGYYAAIPYRYKLHGVEFTSAMVCDVMTHSSMRGKGIFTKLGAYALAEMTKEGLDIAFGYPIRPEVIPGHLKVGWKISGKLPLQLKVLRVDSALKNHSLKFLTPLINLGCKLYGDIFKAKPEAGQSIKVYSINEFLSSEESKIFLNSVVKSETSVLVKDTNFIRWRYAAPEVQYQIVTVVENERIVAAAFVRKTVLKDIPTLAVLDLMVLKDKSSALGSLFSAVAKLASELQVEMISMMITSLKAKEYKLFSFGYIRSPFVFQLITRGLSEKIKSVAEVNAETFNPMWVDSDDL